MASDTTTDNTREIVALFWQKMGGDWATLRWDASFGYNHFKSKVTDPIAPSYIDPVNLPQPEWNANSGLQYGIGVPGGALTPRLEWTYQSKATFNGTPALPYDARFGLTGQAAYDLTATPARSLFNVPSPLLDAQRDSQLQMI